MEGEPAASCVEPSQVMGFARCARCARARQGEEITTPNGSERVAAMASLTKDVALLLVPVLLVPLGIASLTSVDTGRGAGAAVRVGFRVARGCAFTAATIFVLRVCLQ